MAISLGPTAYNPQSTRSLQGGTVVPLQGSKSTQNTIPIGNLQGSQNTLQVTANPNNYSAATVPMGEPGVLGAAYDPYAAYGGRAAYTRLRDGFNQQRANIGNTAVDAANALTGQYNQNIMDTVRNLTQSQSAIDRQRVDNEAARVQGGRDILDMVGRGIRSGGVRLANANAGSSSAAQAIANAYGQIGQRETSKIGNEFAKNNASIDLAQEDLTYQLQQAPERFRVGLMQNVDNIVSQARDQLSALNSAMANASLPDQIAIDQERQSIKDRVLGILDRYNGQLTGGVGNIRAAGGDDIRSRATARLAAGQGSNVNFNYGVEAPAELQNTGPFSSELPIFTYRRNDY